MKLNFSFKNRKLGFYIQVAASALAIIAGIAFLVIDATIVKGNISFKDYSLVTSLACIFGGIVGLAHAFTSLPFLDIVSCVLIGVALGQHLSMSCYPWADIGTGVPFFVNNGELLKTVSSIFTAYVVIIAVPLVGNVLTCFIGTDN